MNDLRETAIRLDPVLWVREILGVTPMAWQETFLRAPRGSSILALTARQIGKTTTAAWGIAHAMLFTPASLSVIACPAQRQSAEAVRRVRGVLAQADAKLKNDNVYGLELENGSRVLALPGSDDSIRGLTVDAWIIADEAARLNSDLISALRPMRARRPQARLAMLSTAWSRSDPFWIAWDSEDQMWIRLKATADTDPALFEAKYLEEERRALGDEAFKREYLGIPSGGQASPFSWELYQRATHSQVPLVPAGPGFGPPPPSPAMPILNPFQDRKLGKLSGAVP
jgi:Terminase large subunit, T4likevirus-type, N-terminal